MSETRSSKTLESRDTDDVARTVARPVRRWILATLGVIAVGIGAVGVFVPGLPTTIFLIFASWCFIRSFPALEQRLLRNKLFARYQPFIDGTMPLSMRQRITSICIMWLFAGTSALIFFITKGPAGWPGYVILAAACVGTIAILRWRRHEKSGK